MSTPLPQSVMVIFRTGATRALFLYRGVSVSRSTLPPPSLSILASSTPSRRSSSSSRPQGEAPPSAPLNFPPYMRALMGVKEYGNVIAGVGTILLLVSASASTVRNVVCYLCFCRCQTPHRHVVPYLIPVVCPA